MKNGIGKINFECWKNIFWKFLTENFGISEISKFRGNFDFGENFQENLATTWNGRFHKNEIRNQKMRAVALYLSIQCLLQTAQIFLETSQWSCQKSVSIIAWPKNWKCHLQAHLGQAHLGPRSSIQAKSAFSNLQNPIFCFRVFPPPCPHTMFKLLFYTLETHPQTPELTF